MSYYEELGSSGAAVDGWRHFLEQHLRFEAVIQGLQVGPEDRVIDLGCGSGALLEYLGRDRPGEYLGVDVRADVVERAGSRWGEEFFRQADLLSVGREDRGDVAVAIGALVGGGEEKRGPMEKVAAMMLQLDALSRRGWALVVLDDEWLAADPLRSLDDALEGASARELRGVAAGLDVEIEVVTGVIPSDLFVFGGSGRVGAAERLAGDDCHRRVLAGSAEKLQAGDEAWFWMTTGRVDRAGQALRQWGGAGDRRRFELLCRRWELAQAL